MQKYSLVRSRRSLRIRYCLLLLLLLPFAAVPARPALGSPALPDPPPPIPPPLLVGANLPQLAQSAVTCTQRFLDGAVAAAASSSPWRELIPTRAIVDSVARSEPRALLMREDSDGSPPSGDDRDGLGQTIAVEADVALLYGSFYYQVAAGSARSGESLRVSIYRGNSILENDRVAFFVAETAAAGEGWQRMEWELVDAAALAFLGNAGQATIMIELRSQSGDGAAQQVWIDDLAAHVCVAGLNIAGRVTYGTNPSADLSNARLVLVREDAAGNTPLLATYPTSDGFYRFSGLPRLSTGSSYRVWFVNQHESGALPGGRIGFWAGPQLSAAETGAEQTLPDFDISDIALTIPLSYARSVLPLSFSWAARTAPTDRYQFCLYDPTRLTSAGAPAQFCSRRLDPARESLLIQLTAQDLAAAADLGFSYGRPYRWYVAALQLGPDGAVEQYGYSFSERTLTLLPGAPMEPPAPPDLPTAPDLPIAQPTMADWTLLIYAAADNALGDPARTPARSRPETHLAGLAALAAQHPQVRIVTFLDRYGDSGGELCYMRPSGEPDCRLQPEPDSADPATLSSFVRNGLLRYPAERTMLLLIGPGHAISGFGTDETTIGSPAMAIPALGAQFASLAADDLQLDLLVAQAPLLGHLDVAAAFAEGVRYMVASPDQIWQIDLAARILPLLSGSTRADPAAVAQGVLQAYDSGLDQARAGSARSLAVYDLAQAREARNALDKLGAALSSDLQQNPIATLAVLNEIRAVVQPYDSSANGLLNGLRTPTGSVAVAEDAFYDAADLAALIAASPLLSPATQLAAEALEDRLLGDEPLVQAQLQQDGTGVAAAPISYNGSGAIALFLPAPSRLGDQATLSYLAFYAERSWQGDWLNLTRQLLARGPASGVGGINLGSNGGAYLRPALGGTLGRDLWLPLVGNR